MALFKFKSKGKTRQLVDLIYPVGSIYISTASTNPGTLFGGTWEAFAPGRVLIGAGQGNDGTTSMSFTANGEYGSYEHELTIDELAYHWHDYAPEWVNGSSTNTGIFGMRGEGKDATYGGGVERVGKSTPFEIIQPSLCVYMWKRVS